MHHPKRCPGCDDDYCNGRIKKRPVGRPPAPKTGPQLFAQQLPALLEQRKAEIGGKCECGCGNHAIIADHSNGVLYGAVCLSCSGVINAFRRSPDAMRDMMRRKPGKNYTKQIAYLERGE
jgi:hypothetical protein